MPAVDWHRCPGAGEDAGPRVGLSRLKLVARSDSVTCGKIKASLVDLGNDYDYSNHFCKIVVRRVIVSHAGSFEVRYIPKRLLKNNELDAHEVAGDGCRSHTLWERNGALL